MSSRWLNYWIPKIYEANGGPASARLQQASDNEDPMLAAIVRVDMLDTKDPKIKISIQKYVPKTGRLRPWKGA